MLEYIRAGNQLIDVKQRTEARSEAPARGLASILIDRALSQRNRARQNLLKHCNRHGC